MKIAITTAPIDSPDAAEFVGGSGERATFHKEECKTVAIHFGDKVNFITKETNIEYSVDLSSCILTFTD